MVRLTVSTAGFVIEEVERLVADRHPQRVLDAGCGRKIQIDPGPDAHITGLDVSTTELAYNDRLDERIVGNIETYPLPSESYDLVVCFDVLEHLDHPDRALANLARASAPGGTLILKCPNAMSFKGLVTKVTPWRFHRWAYRKLLPYVAQAPFPTRMRLMLRPSALAAWASQSGFVIEGFYAWEGYIQRRLRCKLHVDGATWRVVKTIVGLSTRGQIAIAETDLLIVLSRPREQ